MSVISCRFQSSDDKSDGDYSDESSDENLPATREERPTDDDNENLLVSPEERVIPEEKRTDDDNENLLPHQKRGSHQKRGESMTTMKFCLAHQKRGELLD